MIKYMQNKYVITLGTFLYCICIGILYSGINKRFVIVNSLIVFITTCLDVLTTSVFLIPIDSFVNNNTKLNTSFVKLLKAIWISKIILVPVSLFLILLTTVIYLEIGFRVKIINFTMQYICPFLLLYSYKNTTKSDWITTIKVVSTAFILLNLVIHIIHIT